MINIVVWEEYNYVLLGVQIRKEYANELEKRLRPDDPARIEWAKDAPLFEELFAENEPLIPTHHPKINIAQVAESDSDLISAKIDRILNSLSKLTETAVIEEMQEIVPGYKSKFELINE